MINFIVGFFYVGFIFVDLGFCVIFVLVCGFGFFYGGVIDFVYEVLGKIKYFSFVFVYIEMVKFKKVCLFGYGYCIYCICDFCFFFIEEFIEKNREKCDVNFLFRVVFVIDKLVNEDEYFVSRKFKVNVDLLGCFLYFVLYVLLFVYFMWWDKC